MRVIKLRRPLLTLCIILVAFAAVLWVLGIFDHLSPNRDRADLAGAVCATNAAIIIGTRRMDRDRDKKLLIRSLVEVSQRAARNPTVPMARLRNARRG